MRRDPTPLWANRSSAEIKELLMLPYVVGIVLSVGVASFARRVGFDRDRAFYPTVLIVIASYNVLFAAMIGSLQTVVLESAVMAVFVIAAVAGFKGNAWIIVAGWLAMAFKTAFTVTSSRTRVRPPG